MSCIQPLAPEQSQPWSKAHLAPHSQGWPSRPSALDLSCYTEPQTGLGWNCLRDHLIPPTGMPLTIPGCSKPPSHWSGISPGMGQPLSCWLVFAGNLLLAKSLHRGFDFPHRTGLGSPAPSCPIGEGEQWHLPAQSSFPFLWHGSHNFPKLSVPWAALPALLCSCFSPFSAPSFQTDSECQQSENAKLWHDQERENPKFTYPLVKRALQNLGHKGDFHTPL